MSVNIPTRCCTWLVPFAVCVVFLSAAADAASDAECLNATDVTFLSFFPCLPSDDIAKNGRVISCDVFAYAAAVLATEHANNDLLNINLVPVSVFNHQLPSEGFQLENFDDGLTLQLLEFVKDETFLSTLRGVIVPPSNFISAAMTDLFSSRFVNATIVGYGSTDPALDRYPEFFRTIPTDTIGGVTRLMLMKRFDWFRVGVIAREGSSYSAVSLPSLYRTCKSVSFIMLYVYTVAFLAVDCRTISLCSYVFQEFVQPRFESKVTHADSYVESPEEVLRQFRRHSLKVFVGYFGPEDAREVLCQASNENFELTTSEHVWILPAYQQPDWWKLDAGAANSSNCSDEQMVDILNSAIFIDLIKLPPLDISLRDFQLQLISKTRVLFPSIPRDIDLTPYLLHSHAISAYDAVRQLANGISNSLQCCQFQNLTFLQNSLEHNILAEWCKLHYECRNNTDISFCLPLLNSSAGTGPVCSAADTAALPSVSERSLQEHGQGLVSQFINGVDCPMGLFWSVYDLGSCNFVSISELEEHSCSRHLNLTLSYFNVSSSCPSDFYWKGRSSAPDSGLLVMSFISIPKLVFSGVLVVVTLVFCMTLLVFNILWRNNKYVKQSSPRLNVVMFITGPVFPVVSIIMGLNYSIQYYGIPQSAADALCVVQIWMIFLTISFFFVPLLLKNWRLYRIFYNKKLKQRRFFMTDKSLLVLMFPLGIPILVLLIAWTAYDPPHFVSIDIPINDLQLISLSTCSGEHFQVWFGGLVACTSVKVFLALAFSLLNSHIPPGLRKEGRISERALTICIGAQYPLYAMTLIISLRYRHLYELGWWIYLVADIFNPTVVLGVLFIPTIVKVYQTTASKKREQRQTASSWNCLTDCRLRKRYCELNLKRRKTEYSS